eukprot:403367795
MGANFSNFNEQTLQRFITHEYEKVKSNSKKRDYLILSDIINSVQLPEDYPFNFHHLGNLFMMDANKDGRFSHDDLMHFATVSIKEVKKYKQHEINSQLQAFCTLQMWQQVCGDESKESDFVGWLRAETIKALYEILNVRQTHNIEFQSFFALMQQTGEEMGLMSVEEEDQDDYVPLPVIQLFAKNFIQGFSKLMSEIGFIINNDSVLEGKEGSTPSKISH